MEACRLITERGPEEGRGDCALPSRDSYFGGKSRVAHLVWERLGDVENFIEPFCGSAAVLLGRPHSPRIETVNDADAMVANFWRATQHDPDAVAAFADSPVNEADLHARHKWLVLSDEAKEFRRRMRSEPEYFDAKVAGWWCWGLCCWIGGGWCTSTAEVQRGEGKRPRACRENGNQSGGDLPGVATLNIPAAKDLRSKIRIAAHNKGSCGKGVNAAGDLLAGKRNRKNRIDGGDGQLGHGVHAKGERPWEWEQVPDLSSNPTNGGKGVCAGNNRPQLADAYDIGRGVNSQGDLGTCAARRAWLCEWFGRLRDRLRLVRVCCGDWRRVCDSESVTTRLGTTGIFFDPPYSSAAGRDMNLYAVDCGKVAHDVRAYCLERGADKRYRIALCGYEGEGHDELERAGWDVVAWAAQGGYGNRSAKGKANALKERLWFSPGCIRDDGLFAGAAD